MSHGIKKETYVNADEKTTKALTFDLLDKLYEKHQETQEIHKIHLEVCNARFDCLENKKKRDSASASLFGLLGGFLAIVVLWIKNLFQ